MKAQLLIQSLLQRIVCFLLVLTGCFYANRSFAQRLQVNLQYTVSMPRPANHLFHIELQVNNWDKDTIDLKMPQWMPGYYQLMNYANAVDHIVSNDIPLKKTSDNSWQLITGKRKTFKLSYDVKADKQFVANSYLDSTHAYLIPAGLFFHINDHINTSVGVKIIPNKQWNKIATGLEPVAGKQYEFTAPDFDILYDCPILMGNLEELPSFKVKGIEHRFIGYKMADFDRVQFMSNLQKVVEAAVNIIGDIPYKKYTFIGIGPGRGGIEHLNNTTVSFDGKGLNTAAGMNKIMNFLAHEYFHHYNVKRIRPYELGPFNYDKGSKTNLLWVSEGLSVYYEYLIVKRAGLIKEETLLADFESNINAFENDPGRFFQSLTQASYETWADGPFGRTDSVQDRSISYYDKGPVVGLLLDLTIRNATTGKKSLDDVMQFLYWQYYKKLNRGFTDAEFQQACETIAGIPLTTIFEYVYTVKDLDYNINLQYAGLKITMDECSDKNKRKLSINRMENLTPAQLSMLHSWLGE
ncbi:PDZ domain-containing protein [soil metagenome]